MKQVIVTIEDKQGKAVVSFDSDGRLKQFQNMFKGLTEAQLKSLAGHCASIDLLEQLRDKLGKDYMKTQEVQRRISFEEFYHRYGYKVKKQRAEAVWKRLSDSERWRAYAHIPKYEAFLRKKGVAQMYPSTYLNDRPWND